MGFSQQFLLCILLSGGFNDIYDRQYVFAAYFVLAVFATGCKSLKLLLFIGATAIFANKGETAFPLIFGLAAADLFFTLKIIGGGDAQLPFSMLGFGYKSWKMEASVSAVTLIVGIIIDDISHNGVSGLLVPGDTVSGFGTDPGSGFSKVYISFPGNNSFNPVDYRVITAAPPAESIVWSASADFSVPSGKYSVSVKGTDKVGNESVVVSVPVTVDSDAPVTDFFVSGDQSESGWYRGSVTVTAASTDLGTGIMSESVSLSCTPSISIAEGKSASIPASYSGTCDVTVKASDYADNNSENIANNPVKIDNTAPESSSFSPADGSVNGNQIHACINGAKDEHSGLKAGYLRITGPDGERKLTSGAQDGNQVCFDASFSTDGSYSLYYELEDNAINFFSISIAFSISTPAPAW